MKCLHIERVKNIVLPAADKNHQCVHVLPDFRRDADLISHSLLDLQKQDIELFPAGKQPAHIRSYTDPALLRPQDKPFQLLPQSRLPGAHCHLQHSFFLPGTQSAI